jgi:hypothetical protein
MFLPFYFPGRNRQDPLYWTLCLLRRQNIFWSLLGMEFWLRDIWQLSLKVSILILIYKKSLDKFTQILSLYPVPSPRSPPFKLRVSKQCCILILEANVHKVHDSNYRSSYLVWLFERLNEVWFVHKQISLVKLNLKCLYWTLATKLCTSGHTAMKFVFQVWLQWLLSVYNLEYRTGTTASCAVMLHIRVTLMGLHYLLL